MLWNLLLLAPSILDLEPEPFRLSARHRSGQLVTVTYEKFDYCSFRFLKCLHFSFHHIYV